ncbi:MAG: ATP-binding protein [Candidatus Pacearchaeota archaeon]
MKALKLYAKKISGEWKIPKSIQDTIPLDAIEQTGIGRRGRTYSQIYRFSDINYSMSDDEEKRNIFRRYCGLLNSLNPDSLSQITLVNHKINMRHFEDNTILNHQHDDLDGYRREINRMLKKKTQQASGIIRDRYVTVTSEQPSFAEARAMFQRHTNELRSTFRTLGSSIEVLDAKERLRIYHDFYRAGFEENAELSIDNMMALGHSFKDYICPEHIKYQRDHAEVGGKFSRSLILLSFPNFLTDRLLAEITDIQKQLVVTINLLPVGQSDAIREIERRLFGIETNKARWQQKQNESKNWSASIPFSLEQQEAETRELLSDLTARDQHLMFATVIVTILADSLDELDDTTEAVKMIGSKHMCFFATANNNQRAALNSSLPFGLNTSGVWRTLTTESVAIMSVFQAKDIQDKGGIYYGINKLSGNMILLNRERLQNQNAFILGVPGSGKSFAAKREIVFTALHDNADVIIIDPEKEYRHLVEALGGQVIEISDNSRSHLNPLDINEEYSEGANPYAFKSSFIMSLLELIMSDHALPPKKKSIIDRCTTLTLHDYVQSGYTSRPPTLKDFHQILKMQEEPEAQEIALEMEFFTTGTLSTFANETNVDINKRIVSYDISGMGTQLSPIGLLIVLDSIFNRITKNRELRRKTYIFIDEIYLLFKVENAANYLFTLWKRVRKYNAALTGITQNVSDMLQSHVAQTMLANSELLVLLNQSPPDRETLGKLLMLNNTEMDIISDADVGSGLIKIEGDIIPFEDQFPKDTDLYRMMTTSPLEAMY